MEFWTQLGIEKTKDISAIEAAYHKKLPLVNPEDRPDEFKALRSKYEEALRYAKQEETPEKPESELTPVERWTKKLDDVYTHIADRCNATKWKELLSDPLFESLDSRADTFEALMVYLMDHWHLPKEIWQLLDEAFDLRARRDELMEKYPKDFIDNAVISGMEDNDFVPYALFIPQNTGDIDPFFPPYFKAREEILDGNENAGVSLADLDATGIRHPFGELLHIRYDYMKVEENAVPEELMERTRALYEAYPDYSEISGFYADMLSNAGQHAAGIEIYDRILAAEPNNMNISYHKAQSLMEMGEFVQAKALLEKIIEVIPYNEMVRARLGEVNQKVMEQYARTLEEHPDDFNNRFEYAWCLFQNDEDQKALEIMDIPAPEDVAQRCDYENIHTKLRQSTGDFEGCLAHAAVWREFVEKLPEGQTEKEKRRKNKLGDIALMESLALHSLGRDEEARQKTDESLAADPNEYRTYHHRYLICVALCDYDEALRTCEKMVEIKPMAISYHLLGRSQYLKGNMQESFNSFGRALELNKDVSSYVYRARILIMYEEYDDAQEIINLLRENEINSDGVKYCESLILNERDNKEDEAKAIWQAILDTDEKGEGDCEFFYEVCNDMVVYMIRHDANPDEMLAVIDRGLKVRKDYSPLLMNKGYVLDELQDKHEEGLACYRKVYETHPRHSTVCGRMGGIYYFDLHDYPAAMEAFTEQEKRSDSAYCQTMLGNCLSMAEKFDEAESHYKTALEMEADNERVYRDYIDMLMRCRRYDDALALARKLSGLVGERSGYARRKEAQILARMGQYAEAAAIHMELYGKSKDISEVESAADMYIIGGMTDRFLALLKQYKGELGDVYFNLMENYSSAIGKDSLQLKSIRSIRENSALRWRLLADYYYDHNDNKKAIEAVEKYYAEEPDSIMARFIPIVCRKRLGITEGLDALFDEGMKAQEQNNTPLYLPLYLTKIAYLLIAMGRYDEAKECIDKAFAAPLCHHCRFRGCVDGYDALGEYYDALGDYNNAALACLEGQKLSPFDSDLATRLRRLRKEHKKELRKELQK